MPVRELHAPRPAVPASPEKHDAAKLLAIVSSLRNELRGETSDAPVRLDDSLDRDLGFDSLIRVELLQRVEKAFDARLDDAVLSDAETPRDLLRALARAPKGRAPVSPLPTADRASADQAEDDRQVPDTAATLIDALQWHALRHPERTHIIHHEENGGEQVIRYGEFLRKARTFAANLAAKGLEPGRSVAIMLPTCAEYFYTFFGVLLGGGVPVPIYPPARLSQIEEHVRRHTAILVNAAATILVADARVRAVARLLKAHAPGLRRIVSPRELGATSPPIPAPPTRGEDLALLQYTSGSTGAPKGVMLTHANLLANIRALGAHVQIGPQDVVVSWLPLYHDMGLISTWLASLYFGRPIVILSPLAFLAKPVRWLQAIHRHRGTISAAPNFAYELCLRRVDARELEGLDLSSWRVAASGAEQVNPDTVERFCATFAPYGFRRESLMPVYGLAEATVGLIAPPPGRAPRIDRIRREPFTRAGMAEPAADGEPDALRFVACGSPLPGHRVHVVDEDGRELGERREGRIEFQGPSATQGYFRNPEQSRRLFRGAWLDTGDRGYFAGGDFYITGRVKDIVIRGGRHIYPEEIEAVVGNVAGVRKGCVAAFAGTDPARGTERLVVVAETHLRDRVARAALHDAIVAAVVGVLGEPPDTVVLAAPRSVLKTSSGKLRRSATREAYERGDIDKPARSRSRQVLRLALDALVPQLRRAAWALRERSFSAIAWLAFFVLAAPTWLLTLCAGSPRAAWRLNARASRTLLRLLRLELSTIGLERVAWEEAHVVVANHASFIDGLVLLAALPTPHVFAAKRELLHSSMTRIYLARLGAVFIERFAARESAADTERLVQCVGGGRSMAIFPEGTFIAAAGLLPFHLGAFVTAVRANAPVIPVAIRGTRAILRDDEWLPRRGKIAVTIGAAIAPRQQASESVFSAAVRLRDAARRAVLDDCGEPDRSSLFPASPAISRYD